MLRVVLTRAGMPIAGRLQCEVNEANRGKRAWMPGAVCHKVASSGLLPSIKTARENNSFNCGVEAEHRKLTLTD